MTRVRRLFGLKCGLRRFPMPNGGSDCCGTCWFNARNLAEGPEPHFCTIRGLAIVNPFWTYCGNHPHKRAQKDPTPIGPVFVLDSERSVPLSIGEGGSITQFPYYARKVWQQSPDTEDIRLHLLELLRGIEEVPADEYPAGMHTDEMVVWQLGEFREARAVRDLRRILRLSSDAAGGGRTRASLIAEARDALAKINADDGIVNAEPDPEAPRPWLIVKEILQAVDALDEESIANSAARRLGDLLGRAPALWPTVMPKLIHKLRDVGPPAAAVRGLLSGLGAAALWALLRSLARPSEQSKDSRLRGQVAFAIGSFGKAAEEAVAVLEDLLEEDVQVRVNAAIAIWQITRRKVTLAPIILEGFQGDRDLAGKSAACLREMGPAAGAVVPAIVDHLSGGQDGWRRAQAAVALGGMGLEAAQAIPSLIEAAKDPDEDVRGSAYWALRELRALDRLGELILMEYGSRSPPAPSGPAERQDLPSHRSVLPEETVLDIGGGEWYLASALSTSAPHPFVLDGVAIASLEAFLKSLQFPDPEKQKEVCRTGWASWTWGAYGQTGKLHWNGREIDRFSRDYQQLLDRAFEALYTTNKSARNALLATGDAELDHSTASKNPRQTLLTRSEFCQRLSKLRERLKKNAGLD
jgi:HEAT repeat protein